MTKKIIVVSMLALLVVFGINFAAKAESNTTTYTFDTVKALEEKAAKAEKKAAEFEMKLKGTSVNAKSVDDLDNENSLPNIDTPHKSGPALVVGPKGKAEAWLTLTAAGQNSYLVAPTAPYVAWNLEGDVWGVKVKVNVMDATATKIVPANTTFKVGDRVAVQGMMKDGVITATRVRNHSVADDKSAEISAKIQKLIEQMKELCNKITPKPAICATL